MLMKMYYTINESLNPQIVGKDFPQCRDFIKGYNPYAEHALISLYDYIDAFPDYIPYLDGFKLAGSAKLTDFVSSAFCGNLFIVSERARQLLETYNLGPHRFYSLGLYKRNVRHNYYMLHIIINPDYTEDVNYSQSIFKECGEYSIDENFGYHSISSRADFFAKREELKIVGRNLWSEKIVMSPSFDESLDLFMIVYFNSDNFISERLKNAIESEGLTGWEFTPAVNLVVPGRFNF